MLPIKPGQAEFETKLGTLKKTIVAHIEKEEKEQFPQLRRVLDTDQLKKLGERMHERFVELSKQEKPRHMVYEDTGKPKPSHH
jgi:hemerythrin-like domain-containing protein